TRRGLKIITVSGESLPPAPPRSRHIDYRIPFPPFSLTGHVALCGVFSGLDPREQLPEKAQQSG
ncbi:hypothetical protein ACSLOE_30990, partial [Escherichia coli]